MASKNRLKQRPLGKQRYKKLFILSTEGTKTEYFSIIQRIFDTQQVSIKIECINGNKSAPKHVLKKMKRRLEIDPLKEEDEAWLVVDKDDWLEKDLNLLHKWSQEKENYGLAVSNPKFEYWLLLHFEDGTQIKSSQDCSDRLKKHIQNYDKGVDQNKKKKPQDPSVEYRRAT
jgi:hypothetical protein